MGSTRITIGLVALAAFAAGLAISLNLRQPAQVTEATVFAAPRPLPETSLRDHSNAALDRDSFRNRWDILFFGFTHCPDICPTTLFELRQLSNSLNDLAVARQPRIWLISIDPQRDTPEVLNAYISNFGDSYHAATGSEEQIAQFAGGLGVAYQRIPEGDDYTMAHTTALFLVNPDAELVALFSAPHDMTRIAADYRELTR
ncbi:MAG: SCO family protein [Gammaproteobacteria bacterium]|nr:SCO family protein [Gammaproteobacteria bacterium]